MDVSIPQWFDPNVFPPLAIYYGGEDYLVDADRLLERLREKESVNLIKTVKLECEVSCIWMHMPRKASWLIWTYQQHCDFYLAGEHLIWIMSGPILTVLSANAVEWCFSSLVEDIEKTRTDYQRDDQVVSWTIIRFAEWIRLWRVRSSI